MERKHLSSCFGWAAGFEKKTLSPTNQITGEVARRLAANDLVSLAAGKDPGIKENHKEETVESLCTAYLEWAKRNKKSWKKEEYRFKQVQALWGKRQVGSIKRIDVEKLHHSLCSPVG